MSDESFDEKITKIHIEKYWEIYRDSESKRIKAFFYLLIVGILLLIVANQNNVPVNVLLFKFEFSDPLKAIISPLLIVILTLRFYYLSALALTSHVKFNTYFEHYRRVVTFTQTELQNSTSEKKKWKFEANKRVENSILNIDDFRQNDLSEFPNIFTFPMEIDKSEVLILKGHPYLRTMFTKLLNFSLLLLFVFPLVVYLILILLLVFNNWQTFPIEYVLSYILIYFFIGIFLLIALIYFKIKTSDKRSYLMKKNNSSTQG